MKFDFRYVSYMYQAHAQRLLDFAVKLSSYRYIYTQTKLESFRMFQEILEDSQQIQPNFWVEI